jgi:ABC-type cobalamin/Fe3+-siderophores transport system ATPase subunit
VAWIERVKVSGLAGQDKPHEFELNRDTNVFWGLNGCGKTSLLKILHSALQGDASSLIRVPVKEAEITIVNEINQKRYVRKLHRVPQRELELPDLVDSSNIEEYERIQYRAMLEKESISWRTTPKIPDPKHAFSHQYLPISRVPSVRHPGRKRNYATADRIDMLDEATFDRIFAEGIHNIWRDYSTEELVKVRSIQTRGISEILRGVIDRDDETKEKLPEIGAEEAFKYVNAFFNSQKLSMKSDSSDRFIQNFSDNSTLRQIVTEIVDIQRGIEEAQEPTRRIEALLQDLFTGGKSVALTARNLVVVANGHAIPIASLSSGEKQMVRLLLECLVAGKDSIIIDEPELSMHVDWQHRLIDSLRLVNPRAQIIVATHSPEVMATLDDDRIFQL